MHNKKSEPPSRPILCLVAGGSGGHITPALVLGEQWKKQNHNGTIVFVGTRKNLDAVIVKTNKNISHAQHYSLINLPGKKFWLYPVFIVQVASVFVKSMFHFWRTKPQLVLSTGGLIAIPVCAAAKVLRIPVALYELNFIPGKAVRALAPFATTIYTTFERSKTLLAKHAHKCALAPYPLRFSEADKTFDKNAIIANINAATPTLPFDASRKTLFVFGGSQGSAFLNSVIKTAIEKGNLSSSAIQVIHQTGNSDAGNWQKFYKSNNIAAYVFSYQHNVKDFYLLADLILCRGGAGTLFEIAFFERKSFIIPLKSHAAGHQVENAREIARQIPHLCTVFDQDEVACNMVSFAQEITKKLTL